MRKRCALETAGKSLVAGWISWAVAAVGVAALGMYYRHSRRVPNPIVDLGILRHGPYFTSVVGGTPLRIAIGASPFLLPLMLQLGFGLSPLDSGLLTVATAIGSLATRTIMKQVIHHVGFRTLLLSTTTLCSLLYASYSLFRPDTPHVFIFCTLLVGGLVNSMGMVALQTLGFSSIPKERMSHATALSTMAQQLSLTLGVTMGAGLVSLAAWWHDGNAALLEARDFSPAFVAIGMLTLVSLLFFVRLDRNEGAELR